MSMRIFWIFSGLIIQGDVAKVMGTPLEIYLTRGVLVITNWTLTIGSIITIG